MNLPGPPASVLIIKPSSLGDVISGVPVLRGLGRSFPQARVAWLATPACAEVLVGQPGLDEVILFDRKRFGRIGRGLGATSEFLAFCRDLRRWRFEWVIDLQGLFRSGFLARVTGAPLRAGFAAARELAGMFYTHPVEVASAHTVDRNIELARALGVEARGEDLQLAVAPEARRAVESLLAELGAPAGRYLVVAPGTRWANKLYPPRHWRKVLAELGLERPVLLVAAPNQQERQLCAQLAEASKAAFDLAGRTSLPELVALIASAAAVICCDSAANFIAPAVGTPFVTLMGPTQPQRTGPYGPRGMALTAEIPCLGCLRRRCAHVTCMQWIAPEAVVAAARKLLADSAGKALSARPARA